MLDGLPNFAFFPSLLMGSLKEVPNSFRKRLISFVCIFFGMSPVRVHISQEYGNVQKPGKRSSVIFELDEMFLLLQVVCNFDSVVVVCVILDSMYFRLGSLYDL